MIHGLLLHSFTHPPTYLPTYLCGEKKNRWDKTKPPTIENLVLFCSAAVADKYDVEGPRMLPEEKRRKVEARLRSFFG